MLCHCWLKHFKIIVEFDKIWVHLKTGKIQRDSLKTRFSRCIRYIGTMPRLVQIKTWFFGIIHCSKMVISQRYSPSVNRVYSVPLTHAYLQIYMQLSPIYCLYAHQV